MRRIITASFFCLSICMISCHSSIHSEFEDSKSADKGGDDFLSFFSTSREQLAPEEYMNWIENPENGLIKNNTIEECVYTAFFKPLPYVVLKDWDTNIVERLRFNKELEEYKGLQYYSFTIEGKTAVTGNQELLRHKLRSEDDYFARIEYYSFQVQDDMKLIEGEDTLVCRMSHFERAYGLQPKIKIVAGFDRRKDEPVKQEEMFQYDKTFLFYDKVFGAGIIKLKIDKETLKNIPELKIG